MVSVEGKQGTVSVRACSVLKGSSIHFPLEHVQWQREDTFSWSMFTFSCEGKQGTLSVRACSVLKGSRVHFPLEHVQQWRM
jgi:hypothetical protein